LIILRNPQFIQILWIKSID